MGEQRQKLKAWLSESKASRTAEDEAALLKVADIFDTFNETNQLPPEHLELIVHAASSSREFLSTSANDALGSIALRHDGAAQTIADMFKSRNSRVRFAAIC